MHVQPRYLALLAGAGAVAAAIITAPAAAAWPDTDNSTITQRPGHAAIKVEPPMVSPPKVWGPSSSPLFILGD